MNNISDNNGYILRKDEIKLGIPSLNIEESVFNAMNDLSIKKTEAVKKLLRDSKGIELDLEEEKGRRFKSLLIQRDPNNSNEYYYYNDGSKDGLLIATFFFDTPDFGNFNINFGYRMIAHI